MTKHSASSQRYLITTPLKTLFSFVLLRTCIATISFSDIDLSTTTLNPPTSGFTITGNTANDYLGWSVRTAGDINKDGFSDVIIGAYGRNIAYVVYGGEKSSMADFDLNTQTLDPLTTGFFIKGNAVSDLLGFSVSTAGDFNNDGYDDIIVGAYGRNVAYLIYGGEKSSMQNIDLSTTSYPPSVGIPILGNAASDKFGYSVGTAGDINKDGYSDIIIGAYAKNGNQGAAYVIYGGPKSSFGAINLGSATLNPLTTGFKILGNSASDSFGFAVSTAGDVDNDGYDDIIIGANNKGGNRGAAYVIYGRPKSSTSDIFLTTALDPLTTGFMITGNAANNYFGASVSSAGDINNDGYDDVIVGGYGVNSFQGAAYVIYGGPKSSMINLDLSSSPTVLVPLTTGFMISGNAAGSQFGASVSSAGDINKDGYGDIIVGANYPTGKGAAYVIYGGSKSSMLNVDLFMTALDPLTTGFTIEGEIVDDQLGFSVSTAGDIDRDRYSDIIVGAYNKNSKQGAAYVIYACPACATCPITCNTCTSPSVCIECISPYLLYRSECLISCPAVTFASVGRCEDCPTHCSSCTSQKSCQTCYPGYLLSDSLCTSPPDSQAAQEKATQAVSSGAKVIGSAVSVGSSIFPLTAVVSKIVQNTRYLNITVTNELSEIYQTWETNLISWQVPDVFSSADHFKASPIFFARYDIDSPFLVNFWPTLLNIAIGFVTFFVCFLTQKGFEAAKYEGWAYVLLLKLLAGSFSFALMQAYSCLDDILFYLVIDIKTNPFNSFFSWASVISAFVFLAAGCLLVFFNFWTVLKYQNRKGDKKELEAFNERNKYWELFYSDFNDEDLLSQSFFAFLIVRSALSSFTITVLYDYPLMQTSYLVALDGVIILFLYFKMPFKTLRGKLAQYYFEIITLLVHLITFILAFQDSIENPSAKLRSFLSTGIIYLNTALVGGTLSFMSIEIYKTISEKTRARKKKKCENIAIQTVSFEEEEILNLAEKEVKNLENSRLRRDRNNSNYGSSGVLETNFNHDNSGFLEVNATHGISHPNDQSTMPMMIRRRVRIFKPTQQEKFVIENNLFDHEHEEDNT